MKTAIIWMLLASAVTLVACESTNRDNRGFWQQQEKYSKN